MQLASCFLAIQATAHHLWDEQGTNRQILINFMLHCASSALKSYFNVPHRRQTPANKFIDPSKNESNFEKLSAKAKLVRIAWKTCTCTKINLIQQHGDIKISVRIYLERKTEGILSLNFLSIPCGMLSSWFFETEGIYESKISYNIQTHYWCLLGHFSVSPKNIFS